MAALPLRMRIEACHPRFYFPHIEFFFQLHEINTHIIFRLGNLFLL